MTRHIAATALVAGKAVAAGAVLVAALAISAPHAHAQPEPDGNGGYWVHMPACVYEDGNPDARPCLWVDPDTGDGYVNDGHNYAS